MTALKIPSLIFASLARKQEKRTPDLERRGGNRGCTAVTPAVGLYMAIKESPYGSIEPAQLSGWSGAQ